MSLIVQEFIPKKMLKLVFDPESEEQPGKRDIVEFIATPHEVSWTTRKGDTEKVDIRASGKNQFHAKCDLRPLQMFAEMDIDVDDEMDLVGLPLTFIFGEGDDAPQAKEMVFANYRSKTKFVFLAHMLADVMGTKRFDVLANDQYDFEIHFHDRGKAPLVDIDDVDTAVASFVEIANTPVTEKFDLHDKEAAYNFSESSDRIEFHKPKYTGRQIGLAIMVLVFVGLLITILAMIPYMLRRYSNGGMALLSLAVPMLMLGAGLIAMYKFYGRTIPERRVTFMKQLQKLFVETNGIKEEFDYADITGLFIVHNTLTTNNTATQINPIIMAMTDNEAVELFSPLWRRSKAGKKAEHYEKLTYSFMHYIDKLIADPNAAKEHIEPVTQAQPALS